MIRKTQIWKTTNLASLLLALSLKPPLEERFHWNERDWQSMKMVEMEI